MSTSQRLIKTTDGATFVLTTVEGGVTRLVYWTAARSLTKAAPGDGQAVTLEAEPAVGDPLTFRFVASPDEVITSAPVAEITALPAPEVGAFAEVLAEGEAAGLEPEAKTLPAWAQATAGSRRLLVDTESGARYLLDLRVQPYGTSHLLRWPGRPTQDLGKVGPYTGDRITLDADPAVGQPLAFRDDLGRSGWSTKVTAVTVLPAPEVLTEEARQILSEAAASPTVRRTRKRLS